jgi:hypothetical protein
MEVISNTDGRITITVYSEVEMFCTCTVDSFLNSVNNVVMYDVYVDL